MIFVINELKYDTDKMELVSERCEYSYSHCNELFGCVINYRGKNVKLWRSKKNNWLLTFEIDFNEIRGKAFTSEEAQKLLLKYDVKSYEKIFGELEEA